MHIDSDYVGVIHKLEKVSKVVSTSTKLHPVIRDFFALKFKKLSSIQFTKVNEHQDDMTLFNRLSFLEQLNVECNLRAKNNH